MNNEPETFDLSEIDGWIDYYLSKIPDPWLLGGRGGKIQTRFEWGEHLLERKYWRRLLKGEYPGGTKLSGQKRFLEEMKRRDSFLFKEKIWPKLPRFTKKYVSFRYAMAPLCDGMCGKRIIRFAPWGEVDPFYEICDRCKKKVESG
jgi:hypothetical protein